MLNAGKYTAKAVEWALGFTKDGAPQVAVCLEITEGEQAGETINWYGYFTEKTEKRTLESLRALGWSCDDISALTGMGGAVVEIVTEMKEYNGKVYPGVKWVNVPGAGGLQIKDRMTDDDRRDFAARMRELAAEIKPVKPATPAAAPQRPALTPQPRLAARPNGAQAAAAAAAPITGADNLPF